MSSSNIAGMEAEHIDAKANVKRWQAKIEIAFDDSANTEKLDFLHAKVKEAFEKAEKAEKVIKEKDKVIEEKDKTIEEKDKTIEEKEKAAEEAELGKPIVHGFPTPPVFRFADKTASCSYAVTGSDLDWAYSIFRHLRDLPKRARVMGRTKKQRDVISKFTSESDVQALVKAVMTEVAETYQQVCCVASQVQLVASIPDISLFRSFHQKPLTVVEVKKPRGAFCLSTYLQASRYLTNLRVYFGVSAPIAIISTYSEWQICWHKYASPVAEATTIKDVESFCAAELVDADFDSLCVSPVYSYDDPCLLLLLASFVVKATHTPRCDPIQTSCCVYSSERVRTKIGITNPEPLHLYTMVPLNTTEFFLIKPFARGGEGMSLLMASSEGACCVAKFCNLSRDQKVGLSDAEVLTRRDDLCKAERVRWVKAYGDNCGVRVTVLAGRPVVLMPYYEPLSDADWEEPETMKKVLAHFEELATREDEKSATGECRVFHQDIARRHVAWGDANHTCVRLIDWGHASNLESKPLTSYEVNKVLNSDLTTEQKKEKISGLVNSYLAAASTILGTPEPEVPEDEVQEDEIPVPVLKDAFGGKFTEFKDPHTEMYDSDRTAFHAAMRKKSEGRDSS